MHSKALLLFGVLVCAAAHAQETLKVSGPAWDGLSTEEKAKIQTTRLVDLRPLGTYGTVIDNQGVDESTAGTNGGAVLGGALAQTTYIDRAFRGNNGYSATGQLAVGILGTIIGSAIDRPAVQQYHFRYALKLPNGEIQSFDSVKGDAFRHPAGMCLSIPDLSPISQLICSQTTDDLRKQYLGSAPPQPLPTGAPAQAVSLPPASGLILCALGRLQPVATSPEKCGLIGGKTL